MVNSHGRWVGTALIALGVILILAVIGYVGWSQVSAARLRAELRAEPAALVTSEAAPTAVPTAVPAAAMAADSATSAPTDVPTSAQSPAPTFTAVKAVAAPPRATNTRTPATATSQPTATKKPTRAPSATVIVGAGASAATPGRGAEPVRLVVGAPLAIDTKVVPMGWQVVNTKQGPQSEWVIPKNEAGHHINSARLGEQGNLVISGHNNIYGRVFLRISQAWDDAARIKVDDFTDRSDILKGRTITLYDAAGQAYQYKVKDFLRLRDTGVSYEQRVKNGRFILPTDTAQLTIVTCWPPTNNTHRLVVIAEPIQ